MRKVRIKRSEKDWTSDNGEDSIVRNERVGSDIAATILLEPWR